MGWFAQTLVHVLPSTGSFVSSGRSIGGFSLPFNSIVWPFDSHGECHQSLPTPAHAFVPVHGFISLHAHKKVNNSMNLIHYIVPIISLSLSLYLSISLRMWAWHLFLFNVRCGAIPGTLGPLTQSRPAAHGMSEWYHDLQLYKQLTYLILLLPIHSFIQWREWEPVPRVQLPTRARMARLEREREREAFI